MNTKRKVIKQLADKRLKRTNLIIRFSISILGFLVLYDSFVYNTPLYYMLFCFLGILVGRLYFISHKVSVNRDNFTLSLSYNYWSILLFFVLVISRLIFGRRLLQYFHVDMVADGLYLFAIGVYYSKWKVIMLQIDNIYYELLKKKK